MLTLLYKLMFNKLIIPYFNLDKYKNLKHKINFLSYWLTKWYYVLIQIDNIYQFLINSKFLENLVNVLLKSNLEEI